MTCKDTGDADNELLMTEKRIRDVLNPAESWIMSAQSLLVWENPKKSAVLLICVHGLFWFFTYSSYQFFSIVSTATIIIYLVHTWKRRIWPEIRVPPKQPEDRDGWTPVHPRLLSVPELCRHLASSWCYMARCSQWWLTLRRTRPLKFCIEASFIFSVLAVFGHYIPGAMLSYILIMSLVLWPCIQYHSLLDSLLRKCEPVFRRLDFSSKVRKFPSAPTITVYPIEGIDDDITTTTTSVSPDNESDLDEFCPTLNPALSAVLARAVAESDDEGEGPMSFTPNLSKEPSVTNSDDEEEQVNEDDFLLSVDAMPSFEESLEQSDDELLDATESKSRGKSSEPMKFLPSHFDDSSGSDEDTVRHKSSSSVPPPPQSDYLAKSLAESLMSNALKSVMSTALQNLTGLTTDQSQNNSTAQDRVAYTHSDSDDEFDLEVSHGHAGQGQNQPALQDSGEIDIDDEFEFLDEYDLEDGQRK